MNNYDKFMTGNYSNEKQKGQTSWGVAMKRQIAVRAHRRRSTMGYKAIHQAIDNLSNGAFKLYMYMGVMKLDEWQYHKGWTLIAKAIAEDASEMTGYLDEMVHKGYLTEVESAEPEKKNVAAFYDLWEDPEMAEEYEGQQEFQPEAVQ